LLIADHNNQKEKKEFSTPDASKLKWLMSFQDSLNISKREILLQLPMLTACPVSLLWNGEVPHSYLVTGTDYTGFKLVGSVI